MAAAQNFGTWSMFESLQYNVNCSLHNIFFLRYQYPGIFHDLYRIAKNLSNKLNKYILSNKETIKNHPAAHRRSYQQFQWLYRDYSEQLRHLIIKHRII